MQDHNKISTYSLSEYIREEGGDSETSDLIHFNIDYFNIDEKTQELWDEEGTDYSHELILNRVDDLIDDYIQNSNSEYVDGLNGRDGYGELFDISILKYSAGYLVRVAEFEDRYFFKGKEDAITWARGQYSTFISRVDNPNM